MLTKTNRVKPLIKENRPSMPLPRLKKTQHKKQNYEPTEKSQTNSVYEKL